MKTNAYAIHSVLPLAPPVLGGLDKIRILGEGPTQLWDTYDF